MTNEPQQPAPVDVDCRQLAKDVGKVFSWLFNNEQLNKAEQIMRDALGSLEDKLRAHVAKLESQLATSTDPLVYKRLANENRKLINRVAELEADAKTCGDQEEALHKQRRRIAELEAQLRAEESTRETAGKMLNEFDAKNEQLESQLTAARGALTLNNGRVLTSDEVARMVELLAGIRVVWRTKGNGDKIIDAIDEFMEAIAAVPTPEPKPLPTPEDIMTFNTNYPHKPAETPKASGEPAMEFNYKNPTIEDAKKLLSESLARESAMQEQIKRLTADCDKAHCDTVFLLEHYSVYPKKHNFKLVFEYQEALDKWITEMDRLCLEFGDGAQLLAEHKRLKEFVDRVADVELLLVISTLPELKKVRALIDEAREIRGKEGSHAIA